MGTMNSFFCPVCGGDLDDFGAGRCRCLCCGKIQERDRVEKAAEDLCGSLGEASWAQMNAARKSLWDAMHEDHFSMEKCLGYAYALKDLVPDDYLAGFAVEANCVDNGDSLSSFLINSTKEDIETYADTVVDYALRVLTPKTCAAVGSYIEKAFDPISREYRKYTELYDEAANEVYPGLFDVGLRRDVFIAYSVSDIDEAAKLCVRLEKKGMSCFLSARNLMRGKSAAGNYERSIETAIDSCETFVFVSSGSSRSDGCDAMVNELLYVMRKEQAEHKNVNYDKISQSLLKPRAEYLIEPYTGSSYTERQVRSFFHGLEPVTDPDELVRWISKSSDSLPSEGVRARSGSFPGSPSYDDDENRQSEDAERQLKLGKNYWRGEGVKKNPSMAVRCWRRAAEQGNPEAQVLLADCCVSGNGTKQNYPEAVRWYAVAAERGNTDAKYNLGVCYFKGLGVKQDFERAIRWLNEAADEEHVGAQCGLGICYANGYGVSKDNAEALKWYKKAAERGNASAMHNIACCYLEGIGVAKDPSTAFTWFEKGARSGNAESQLSLGNCYFAGVGTEKDYFEAVLWYRKATRQKNAEARYRLGCCFRDGVGVIRDENEGERLIREAQEQGFDPENNIKRGHREMTRNQADAKH